MSGLKTAPVELDSYTPDRGEPTKWNPFGQVTDGYTPSTRKQLDDVRRFCVQQCEEIGCDCVAVTVNWVHQFPTRVVVDKYGFLRDNDGTDFSYDQFLRESAEQK